MFLSPEHYPPSRFLCTPMQVLFTHGYFLCDDPKEQEIMRPYPPLGLLYLSAWLDKHGMENEVFDTTFSTKNDLKDYLLLHRPRIVAFEICLFRQEATTIGCGLRFHFGLNILAEGIR